MAGTANEECGRKTRKVRVSENPGGGSLFSTDDRRTNFARLGSESTSTSLKSIMML